MSTSSPNFRPFVFLRRGRVWTLVRLKDGKKSQVALKFRGPEGERDAKRFLAKYIAQGEATEVIAGRGGDGPLTVARWSTQWLASRQTKGIATVADYRSRLEHHVLPLIGDIRLDKVTTDDVANVMARVAGKGLAPRTQRHVYDAMRAMFGRAVPRLLETNPCSIHTEDLPAKKDVDPEWRPNAIFTREEVRRILTDPLIVADRRVYYGVMFLGGLRFGEISGLSVRHYLAELEPLGQLQVGRSYNSKTQKLKGVKTDRPRLVPVHPWLAQLLNWWLAVGFAEMMGRAPKADDVLIPSRRGNRRNCSTGWTQFNEDLTRLGMRARRQHDARRTFITLARADGARKDLLRLVTHGAEGDIVDVYTEMPWAPLCEEVAKLKLAPPPPAPLTSLPNPAGSLGEAPLQVATPVATSGITEGDSMVTYATPAGFEPVRRVRTQTEPGGQSQTAREIAGPSKSEGQPDAASSGQSRPLATLATLALRAALAALDRGRIDQAQEILRRAVAEESIGDGPPRKEASRSGGER